MDPATLAAAALTVLSPYLVKAGQRIAENIADSLPENAASLWKALTDRLAGKPAAEAAVRDLAQEPADEDNQAALRKELKKALAEDPQFLAAMTGLLEKAQKESQSIHNSAIAGENSTAVNVGGDVQGNIVIGEHNTVNNPNKKK